MPKRYDILRIDPQDKPIYLVREAFDPEGEEENVRFWYDESTCPTNVLNGNFEEVIIDGDTDPHGIFIFVRTIDEPEFLHRSHDPSIEWPKVLPEAFEGQRQTSGGDVPSPSAQSTDG